MRLWPRRTATVVNSAQYVEKLMAEDRQRQLIAEKFIRDTAGIEKHQRIAYIVVCDEHGDNIGSVCFASTHRAYEVAVEALK